MFKDSMSILVILCLTVAMILSVASTSQKNITGNNLNVSNTLLNNTSLSNVMANNTSMNAVFHNSEINGYASQIGNGIKTGQCIDKTGHARYTNNLGSLAKKETNKPGKDLEKVVFICNIV